MRKLHREGCTASARVREHLRFDEILRIQRHNKGYPALRRGVRLRQVWEKFHCGSEPWPQYFSRVTTLGPPCGTEAVAFGSCRHFSWPLMNTLTPCYAIGSLPVLRPLGRLFETKEIARGVDPPTLPGTVQLGAKTTGATLWYLLSFFFWSKNNLLG